MTRERFEELAALSAIGAATHDERSELEAVVSADATALAEFRSFCDAGAVLAEALPSAPPPAGVLDALRRDIAQQAAAPASPPAFIHGGHSSAAVTGSRPPADVIDLASRRRRAPVIVATSSLVAAAAMTVLWLGAAGEADDLRERMAAETQKLARDLASERRRSVHLDAQLQAAGQKLDQAQARLEFVSTPRLSLSTLAPDARGPTVKIFVDPEKRQWLVYAFELPPVPEGKDYQLWFLSEDAEAPVSGGVLTRRPDGSLETQVTLPPDLTTVQQAAISLEAKGGVQSPTMDQIKIIGPL